MGLDPDAEAKGIFGYPVDTSPEQDSMILANLRKWIIERFRLQCNVAANIMVNKVKANRKEAK